MTDEQPRRTWYIEARVGSENYGGRLVHFIDDRRGGDGAYINRPAEEVLAEAFAEVDRLRAALVQARADALREAAKVAARGHELEADGPCCPDCYYMGAAALRTHKTVNAIRALQSTPPASAPPTYPAWDCLGCGLGYSRRCARCRERDPSSRPFGYPEHAPPAVECDGSGVLYFGDGHAGYCPGCPSCKSKERR